jgi:Lrp/AsnC family transcriptional regulator for asnA, asnC and gidA
MYMDAMDEEILAILKKDARESYVNIASKLNTSEGTIRGRVKKLVEQGVITRFTIRTKGKNVKALIAIQMDINAENPKAHTITEIEGVEMVYEVSGDNDLIALVDVMSTEDLNEIIEDIRNLGVKATRTMLILKEHYS